MRIKVEKKKEVNLDDVRMNVNLGDGGRRAEEEVLLWRGLGRVLLQGGSPHIHLQGALNPHIHLQSALNPHIHLESAINPHIQLEVAINPKGAIIHIVGTAYIRIYPLISTYIHIIQMDQMSKEKILG